MRVVICDDHPIFREGLKKTLSYHPDIRVVGEAGSSSELFDLLAGTPCDVVVLDISLPDSSGLEVLRRLREGEAGPAVVVLSMHSERQYAVRAIQAGARAYIEKASVPAELVNALRKVAAGGAYLSPAQAEQLALEVSSAAGAPAPGQLTERERRVLKSLAAGQGLKQIAHEMGLSPSTVATYRGRALAKLKLKTTADLILYAMENDLNG
jgi:two-component system invasion response regulator UvrY